MTKILKGILITVIALVGYAGGKYVTAEYFHKQRYEAAVVKTFEATALTRKNFIYMKRYFPELYSALKQDFADGIVAHCKANKCGKTMDPKIVVELAAKSNAVLVRFLKSNTDKLGGFPEQNVSMILDFMLAQYEYVLSSHSAKACQLLAMGGPVRMMKTFPLLNKDTKLRDMSDNATALVIQSIAKVGVTAKPRPPVVQRDYDLVIEKYQKLGGDVDGLANADNAGAKPEVVCNSMMTFVKAIKQLDNPEKRRLSLELVASLMGET
jgi:hypothetical protein